MQECACVKECACGHVIICGTMLAAECYGWLASYHHVLHASAQKQADA